MLEMTNRIVLILLHEQQGNPIFGITFSLNRHKFSVSQVRFNDFTTKLAKYETSFNSIEASICLFFLPQSMQENPKKTIHA